MLTMLSGLCVLALPVAIISTGFAQEVNRRDFVITWSLMSRIPVLAELDAAQAAEVLPLLRAHNLPPHMEVIPAGGLSDAIYFVASGCATARRAPRQTFSTRAVSLAWAPCSRASPAGALSSPPRAAGS